MSPSEPNVEGESLTQFLACAGRLPVLQGLALAAQLLSALQFAHRQGVVHGAIDMQQLLVSRCGRLKVTGFGCAALDAAGRPRPDPPDVSPSTAPEQILGRQADHRSDLYAAAVVAYELLTGASPFVFDETPGAGDPPRRKRWPPTAARPGLPIGLNAVFKRALAQDPDARYQEAAELSAALQQAVGTPVWSRPSLEETRRRFEAAARRRQSPIAALVTATRGARQGLWAMPRPRRLGWVAGCAAALVVAAVQIGGGPAPATITAVPATSFVTLPDQPVVTGAREQPLLAASPVPLKAPLIPVEPSPRIEAAALTGPPAVARDPAPNRHATAQPAARVAGVAPHERPPAPRTPRHPKRTSPPLDCGKTQAIAGEICAAFRCATAEFRRHPVCVQMHADASARYRLAEPRDGP